MRMNFDAAVAAVDQLTLDTAASIARQLESDREAYLKAMVKQTQEEPGTLDQVTELVEKLVNKDSNNEPVVVGEVVEYDRGEDARHRYLQHSNMDDREQQQLRAARPGILS